MSSLTDKNSYIFEHISYNKNSSDTHLEEPLFHKKIWRVNDVAKFLGCSKGHIYNLVSIEMIPSLKKGKFLYFIPSDILRWLLQGD